MPDLSIDPAAAKSGSSAAIFILADTSGSMAGKPVTLLQDELAWLVGALRNTLGPNASLRLALTTFGHSIDAVRPLTKLSTFSVPRLRAGGFSAAGEALQHILPALEKEPRAALFILGDGQSTDDCREVPAAARNMRQGPIVLAGLKPCVQMPALDGNWIKKVKLSAPQDARGIFTWLLEVSKALCSGALNAAPAASANWPAIPKQLEWVTEAKQTVPIDDPAPPRKVIVPESPAWFAWREEWE